MSVVFNGVLHFNVRGQMALVLVDSCAHATRKSRSFTEGVHVLYVYLQVAFGRQIFIANRTLPLGAWRTPR